MLYRHDWKDGTGSLQIEWTILSHEIGRSMVQDAV